MHLSHSVVVHFTVCACAAGLVIISLTAAVLFAPKLWRAIMWDKQVRYRNGQSVDDDGSGISMSVLPAAQPQEDELNQAEPVIDSKILELVHFPTPRQLAAAAAEAKAGAVPVVAEQKQSVGDERG